MADPSMMSLFGDDGNLFSDELEGLGDCGYPAQAQANPMAPAMAHEHQAYGPLSSNIHMPPQAVPGQPKLGPPPGHHYDHFSQYEQQQQQQQQQGGRMLANGPVNGMSSPQSRFHSASAGPAPPGHHGYPGPQGDGRAQAFGDGGGAAWGPPPQVVQVPEQGRPPFQSPQQQQQAAQAQHGGSGPQGHGGHQMGPYMGHNDYSMPGHGQTQTPPRMNHFPQSLPQESGHFMGHVGLQQSSNLGGPPGAPPMRHPAQQPTRHPQPPQQFLHRPSQAGHRPDAVPGAHNAQYPASPSRQQQQQPQPPPQQVIPGRAHPNMGYNMHSQPVPPNTVTSSGQYPPYPPYGNLNQGLANPSGMSPSMSLNTSSSYPSQGGPPPQQARYPPSGGPQQGPMHQQQQAALHQMNQMNAQPMHPGQTPSAAQQKLQQQQQQKQQHLPPPQGSYGSPPSMSPMRNMSTPAGTPPPPQHSRPPSAGLGPDMVAAGGYAGVPPSAAGSMSLPQRVQPMGHPPPPQQQQLPSQVYNPLSPNHRAQGRAANPSHELPAQQGQSDQRLHPQQAQRVGPQLQSPPMPFQQQQQQPQPPQQQQLQQVCPPSAALPPPQQTHLAAIHQNSPPSQQPWAPPHQSTPPSQKVPLMQVGAH